MTTTTKDSPLNIKWYRNGGIIETADRRAIVLDRGMTDEIADAIASVPDMRAALRMAIALCNIVAPFAVGIHSRETGGVAAHAQSIYEMTTEMELAAKKLLAYQTGDGPCFRSFDHYEASEYVAGLRKSIHK